MDIAIEDTSKLGRKVTLTIPESDVKQEYENIVKKTKTRANIPGFRPGKAPRAMLEKRWKESFKGEVMENLIPKYIEKALKEKSLKPAYRPELIGELKLEVDQPFSFSVEFEVQPTPEEKYDAMFELKQEKISVGDDEIAKELEKLQKHFGTYTDSTEPVSEENKVQLEFLPEPDESRAEQEPLPQNVFTLVIGRNEQEKVISDACLGKKVGEMIKLSPPQKAEGDEAEAKENVFLVRKVEKLGLAELNEEFFKKVSELHQLKEPLASKDDLKKLATKNLREEKKAEILNAYHNEMRKQIYEKLDYEVPQKTLEHRAHSLAHEYEREEARAKGGANMPDEDDHSHGQDYQKHEEKAKVEALNQLRTMYFIDNIFERESLKLDERELQMDFITHCYYIRQNPNEYIKTQAGGYLYDYLESMSKEKMVLNHLISKKYGADYISFPEN